MHQVDSKLPFQAPPSTLLSHPPQKKRKIGSNVDWNRFPIELLSLSILFLDQHERGKVMLMNTRWNRSFKEMVLPFKWMALLRKSPLSPQELTEKI